MWNASLKEIKGFFKINNLVGTAQSSSIECVFSALFLNLLKTSPLKIYV